VARARLERLRMRVERLPAEGDDHG
jgi:hypothetical protein